MTKHINSRQSALIDGISSVFEKEIALFSFPTQTISLSCRTLIYALAELRVQNRIVECEGTFYDLLEVNNIFNRQVKTPKDLMRCDHPMLIVFASDDGRALAVHRFFGNAVYFDPLRRKRQRLDPKIDLKSYAYEIYAQLPPPPNTPFRILGFMLRIHIIPLIVVLISALIVAVLNLSIPFLTGFLV